MKIANKWKDYEIIATSEGEKLERWKDVYLLRPDPQIIWKTDNVKNNYHLLSATYKRSSKGGGEWNYLKPMKDKWIVNYGDMLFYVKPMGFKHMGLFPEQAANWDYMQELIEKAKRPISVLNLFAYTGGATVACALKGATVTHVDCVKQIVEQAKENVELNKANNNSVRYIVDDCKKFVEREIRRGHKYDAIIMDPPSFGRANNSVWKLEDDIFDFVKECAKLLSDNPLFMLINSYTTGISKTVIEDIMKLVIDKPGFYESYELGIPTKENIVLPCGYSSLFIGNQNGKKN